MTVDPAIEALRRLCETHGGRLAVATAIHANEQTLYQILEGVPLKSGKPRSVGRDLRDRLDRQFPGWLTTVLTAGEGLHKSGWAVSQTARHSFDTLEAPLLQHCEIMKADRTGPFFRTQLDDDSCAPDLPRGVEILRHTEREARPGRIVLVADRHGRAHVRQYRQGRAPGQWLAAAINPAYASLDSVDDGLMIIAVKKAVLEPDD